MQKKWSEDEYRENHGSVVKGGRDGLVWEAIQTCFGVWLLSIVWSRMLLESGKW